MIMETTLISIIVSITMMCILAFIALIINMGLKHGRFNEYNRELTHLIDGYVEALTAEDYKCIRTDLLNLKKKYNGEFPQIDKLVNKFLEDIEISLNILT